MLWPEPLKYFYSKKGYPDNCVEAANKMLADCKAAYAKENANDRDNKLAIANAYYKDGK